MAIESGMSACVLAKSAWTPNKAVYHNTEAVTVFTTDGFTIQVSEARWPDTTAGH
jgi:hypothetical protein